MREIVYFWVSEYRNIKEQGINFGSEYEYFTEMKEGKIIINRKNNYSYIPNFFQSENSKSIINISAIVGENGAGKSNFLDALKFALTNDRDSFEYIIIFKDGDGFVFHIDKTTEICEYHFEESEGTPAFTDVIYYNPALDNKIYPIVDDNNAWIDISTDWLIYQDFQEQGYTKPEISQIELFWAEEIERQLKLSNDSDFVIFINQKIVLPSEIRIVSVSGDFPFKIEGENSIRNVPYHYRNYYDLLTEKSKIITEYAIEEHELQKLRIVADEINPFTRKKCFATFLFHLLKNMFYHFDASGRYLLDGGETNLDKSELIKLNFEDAVILFIENINLIENRDAIISFIEYVKNLIFESKVKFINIGEISWISPKEKISRFIELKDLYLKELGKFLDYDLPRSFISYTWIGLSTGEKAIFNLFSRFYYAKLLIIEKVQSKISDANRFPNMLYLLIDEAELGFHLQWQKEYINDLIEFIPKTLMFIINNEHIYPKIQIIFTTHSTLSLSDIPNTHITYLKKEEGLSYILKNEEKPKASFGANVHTLMSDSFFLRNGLVGSFAIKKINETISLLNSKELSEMEKNKVRSVINIINEPILRNKLQSIIQDKHSKICELDKLERAKELIELRINKLKGND